MTRETYIKVAKAVNKQLRRSAQNPRYRIRIIQAAASYAALAKADNPNFSVKKFVGACVAGVPLTEHVV